jgi:hypothetical protein
MWAVSARNLILEDGKKMPQFGDLFCRKIETTMPAQWHVADLVGSPLSLLCRQEPTFADISLQTFGVSLQRFGVGIQRWGPKRKKAKN